jgi:hypothetical protein
MSEDPTVVGLDWRAFVPLLPGWRRIATATIAVVGWAQEDASRYRYESLCRFFLTIIGGALADIAIYRKRYADLQALSETAVAVLACFKSSLEQRLRVATIESTTGFSRRTIQYALKTLADQQFLQKLGKWAGSRYQLAF